MKKQKTKYQRLSYDERVLIEDRLNQGFSVKSIAKFLNRSPSSISREIKRHSVTIRKSTSCSHINNCEVKNLCTNCRFKGNSICKRCPECYKLCSLFSPMSCSIKELGVSEATLHRLIGHSELSIRNIDLRRQVKLKPRKKKTDPEELLHFKKAKEGHTWEDFIIYIDNNPELHYVEMDCVEGKREDRSVLLTLHIKYLHLQLAIILQEHTQSCVVEALDKLEHSLGKELFSLMFPVILTDNGHEFADRLLLKKSIGNRSPYELARFYGINDDFFIFLGLEEIPTDEINLTPKLFSYKKISSQS